MIDLAALTSAAFDRVATHAAGAVARAALAGDPAGRIITAEQLRRQAQPGRLPAVSLPLLAFRRWAAPTGDRVNILPRLTWYAYGDPAADYAPLDALALPLWQVYQGWGDGGIYSVEFTAGGHDSDRALGLLFVRYDLDIGTI